MLTQLGIRLEDVPKTIGWHSAYIFSKHLGMTSAVFQSMYPEYAVFCSPLQQSTMLSEIIEGLQWLKYDYDVTHTEKGAHVPKPKPYPTPWADQRQHADTQSIGKGAIPKSEFDAWYYGED